MRKEGRSRKRREQEERRRGEGHGDLRGEQKEIAKCPKNGKADQ